jgi:OOP family OmpA-OmpF porin
MNKRLRWAISSSLFAGCACTAAADDSVPFDDRYYLAPMGSLALVPNSRADNNAFGGALALGKSVAPHLGVEILGDYLRYDGKTTTTAGGGLLCGVLGPCAGTTTKSPSKSLYSGGLGANYYLSPENAGLFAHADAQGGEGLIYNAGLGLDQPLFNRSVYLRAEALYHKESHNIGEALFHLGVRIPLGAVPEPAQPAPAPVAVVPVEQPAPPPEAPPAPAPEPAKCQPPAPGQPISLEGCKLGDTIVLHGVNFEFNKATLTVNAKTLLDQVADALLARKDIKVEIDGHTDGKGSVSYNQRLSEARAATVMKYLAGRGIEAGRMSSRGFGKSMPIADNATEEGRELNRRVEMKVTESADGQVQDGASARPAAPAGEPSASGQAPAAAAPAASADAAPPKAHGSRHHKKHAASAAEQPSAAAPQPEAAPDNAAAAAPAATPEAEPAEPAPADAAATPAAAAPAPQPQAAAAPEAPAAPPAPASGAPQLSDDEARKIANEISGGK